VGRSPLVVKYTREQRLRAMRLYERYDCRAVSVINELGHSSKEMLACRHCVWVEVGRDDGESLGDGQGERYTPERKRMSIDHYFAHGRCVRRTIVCVHLVVDGRGWCRKVGLLRGEGVRWWRGIRGSRGFVR
jgi:hypothetical protein